VAAPFGVIWRVGFFARFPKERELLLTDDFVWSFRHVVAVDEDVFRKDAIVSTLPQTEQFVKGQQLLPN
jgi:hypothetical protein